jgi:MFS family permease
MPQLIVARGIQGLGAAGLIPIALTVSGDIFSLEERARVQGLFSAVWGFASLVGPLLGAWMTISLGWRSIFAINVPLGILAAALVWTKMIESRSALPDPVDLAGTLTLAGGMTALLFAVLRAPEGGAMAAPSVPLLLLAAALLGVFVRIQMRRSHPLIPPDLFRRWATAAPYLGGTVLGTTIFGVSTFVPLYVQGARGGTAGSAGAVITPLILMWALSAAVSARFVVRFGFRTTARAGSLLSLVGLAGLIAAAFERAGVGWISLACGLVGSGLGPSSLSQILVIQDLVPEQRRGVATSLVPFSRTVGGSIGVGALGGILAAGLSARLGPAAEKAGALLAGPHAAGRAPMVAPVVFREAIEVSLLPIFLVIGALAIVNVFISSAFPRYPAEPPQVRATEAIV